MAPRDYWSPVIRPQTKCFDCYHFKAWLDGILPCDINHLEPTDGMNWCYINTPKLQQSNVSKSSDLNVEVTSCLDRIKDVIVTASADLLWDSFLKLRKANFLFFYFKWLSCPIQWEEKWLIKSKKSSSN